MPSLSRHGRRTRRGPSRSAIAQRLAGPPGHGYRIIASLRERSAGAFDLPEGPVYSALHPLEARGLVRSRWAHVDGRRRRLYELTAAGVAALRAVRAEWTHFATGVDRVNVADG